MSNKSLNRKLQDVDDIKLNYQNDFGDKYLSDFQAKRDSNQDKISTVNNLKEMISVFILSKNKLLVVLLLFFLSTIYTLHTAKPKWIMNTNNNTTTTTTNNTNNTNTNTNNTTNNTINNYRLILYSLIISLTLCIFTLSIIYYKFPLQYKHMLFAIKSQTESTCSVCIE
jgi:hypothetical protein